MKTINFDYTGGFPLEQPVLKRMQSANLLVLDAFVKQLGCEDIGNYIISGCKISGENITPGIMYIDGELCLFAGAVGDQTTKIKKQTNTLTAPFENGTNPPVFIETLAVVNAAGTELQNFTRFFYVQDANYVHTDRNFTNALLQKLNGIQANAQVNVRPDWNENNSQSPKYIENRPVNILEYLYKGVAILGDFPGATNSTTYINFPDIGTDNYMVLGTIHSFRPLNNAAEDLIVWFTAAHQSNNFRLGGYEPFGGYQNIRFEYIIIPL